MHPTQSPGARWPLRRLANGALAVPAALAMIYVVARPRFLEPLSAGRACMSSNACNGHEFPLTPSPVDLSQPPLGQLVDLAARASSGLLDLGLLPLLALGIPPALVLALTWLPGRR